MRSILGDAEPEAAGCWIDFVGAKESQLPSSVHLLQKTDNLSPRPSLRNRRYGHGGTYIAAIEEAGLVVTQSLEDVEEASGVEASRSLSEPAPVSAKPQRGDAAVTTLPVRDSFDARK
jgi:hypothetical protein